MVISGLFAAVLGVMGLWFFLSRAPAPVGAARAQAPAPPAAALQQAEGEDGSFRICNQTTNPVSIAFGYRAERGWQSEGWWVAGPGECQTVYNGSLDARYYYVYAADDIGGGSWDGQVFMCTRDESFTIFGVEDCLARGYERTGFFEVDTQNRSNWMLQLTDSSAGGSELTGSAAGGEPAEGEVESEGEGAAD